MGASRVKSVVDLRGRTHQLTGDLGGGGFGAVYLTANDRTLVKVSHKDSPSADLARLRALPLEQLPVVSIVCDLAPPDRGYVMEAAVGGVSLCMALQVGLSAPSFLSAYRRLSEVLVLLHARGLVFGDLNPNNVLISKDAERIVLIDLDGLAAVGSTVRQRVRHFQDPARGANAQTPEDIWSLCLLLQCIWDADARKLGPFGDPPSARFGGIAPSTSALVEEVFGAGRLDHDSRPRARAFWHALSRDEDALSRCLSCTSWLAAAAQCTTCGGSSPPGLSLEVITGMGPTGVLWLQEHARRALRRRHVNPVPSATEDDVWAWASARNGTVSVVAADGAAVPVEQTSTGSFLVRGPTGERLELVPRRLGASA